ncbi:MAG: Esterase YbfF [Turneriella sp.]|nr:Esterase YbfF [Turneriella sp.]
MRLAYDFYEGNPERTLILLHGLFGSAKNFTTIAERLTPFAKVYAYDARNHGRSTHTKTHSLSDLVEDLKSFIDEHRIQNPYLMGHSMGGLTAMAYVRMHTASKLIVLDIAPRSYEPNHESEIAAQKMDVASFTTRSEVDKKMAGILPNPVVRQFLQMNMSRDTHGKFFWTNNIAAIENSLDRTEFPKFTPPLFEGPTLCVRGLESNYVTDADVALLRTAFPRLSMHDFPDATHWLHHTHRDKLLLLVEAFLQG